MWPFSRKLRAAAMSEEDFAAVLAKLTREMGQLRDDHDALQAQHVKLRGRVYAIWGKGEPEEAGVTDSPTKDTSKMSREELKRYLASSGRFIPGRPAQHSE